MITCRTMTPDDIPAGLSLCRAAGWNQVAADWEMFLNMDPDGCRVAEKEKVVGTVATLRYRERFSWIGMVLVDPDFRRQGIGNQLMLQALEILKEQETIKLDATPAGREVYLKLNFSDEYPLNRMLLEHVPVLSEASAARPAQISDLAVIHDFDRDLFGADRGKLLEWMFHRAPHLAFISGTGKGINGFCLGRKGFNYIQVGPVGAESVAIGRDLVLAALKNCAGLKVVLDITRFDPAWQEWLEGTGFRVQRPFMRMYKGSNRYPGTPEKQLAILGPEFG